MLGGNDMKGIVKTILGCLFLSLGFSGLTGITAFAAAERIDNARYHIFI